MLNTFAGPDSQIKVRLLTLEQAAVEIDDFEQAALIKVNICGCECAALFTYQLCSTTITDSSSIQDKIDRLDVIEVELKEKEEAKVTAHHVPTTFGITNSDPTTLLCATEISGEKEGLRNSRQIEQRGYALTTLDTRTCT